MHWPYKRLYKILFDHKMFKGSLSKSWVSFDQSPYLGSTNQGAPDADSVSREKNCGRKKGTSLQCVGALQIRN